jgi:segregation and condensation protein B
MDYFGINTPDQLPKISEVLADQIVEPTLVNADHFDVEDGNVLLVSEEGELIVQIEEAIRSSEPPGDEGSGMLADDATSKEDPENDEKGGQEHGPEEDAHQS